jgi:hypothetical protein
MKKYAQSERLEVVKKDDLQIEQGKKPRLSGKIAIGHVEPCSIPNCQNPWHKD